MCLSSDLRLFVRGLGIYSMLAEIALFLLLQVNNVTQLYYSEAKCLVGEWVVDKART